MSCIISDTCCGEKWPMFDAHEMLSDKLRLAATRGQTDKVQELIEAGATFEKDREGRTALHLVASFGHCETLKVLIEAGCDVNIADNTGFTAIHRATIDGHVECIKILLDADAAIDKQDEVHGNTPLHEAAWKGFSQSLQLLTKAKANPYIKNKAGFIPLHLACQNGHNESCRVLLLAGCKPDVKNSFGDTPLLTSARYGHAGVTRILLSARCNVNDQNKNGDTALHISAAMGRRKLSRILVESGCDITLKNKQGETALNVARRKGCDEVVTIIQNTPKIIKPRRLNTVKNRSSSADRVDGRKKNKHKVKTASKVHFIDDMNDLHSKSSPYGCHFSPPLSTFPTPKLDSLPNEPLQKGEQYYLDLAGNIKKGPIGVGYMCYCAPFFHHVEQKLEVDKQELKKHIDAAHEDLQQKICSLERKTRTQLHNIHQTVKEKIAEEKNECLERIERKTIVEHNLMRKQQDVNAQNLKKELTEVLEKRLQRLSKQHTIKEDFPRSKSADILTNIDSNSNDDMNVKNIVNHLERTNLERTFPNYDRNKSFVYHGHVHSTESSSSQSLQHINGQGERSSFSDDSVVKVRRNSSDITLSRVAAQSSKILLQDEWYQPYEKWIPRETVLDNDSRLHAKVEDIKQSTEKWTCKEVSESNPSSSQNRKYDKDEIHRAHSPAKVHFSDHNQYCEAELESTNSSYSSRIKSGHTSDKFVSIYGKENELSPSNHEKSGLDQNLSAFPHLSQHAIGKYLTLNPSSSNDQPTKDDEVKYYDRLSHSHNDSGYSTHFCNSRPDSADSILATDSNGKQIINQFTTGLPQTISLKLPPPPPPKSSSIIKAHLERWYEQNAKQHYVHGQKYPGHQLGQIPEQGATYDENYVPGTYNGASMV